MMKLQVKILHGVLENYCQTNQLDNEFIKISAGEMNLSSEITRLFYSTKITDRVHRIRVEQWV